MVAIMLWTTLVCIGGEIKTNPFFGPHIYSGEVFTSIEKADKKAYLWQTRNNRGECINFMIQKEDVSQKQLLKIILGIY